MPPFRMSVSKEQVEGKELVPDGIYQVRFIKFSPKLSKPQPGALNSQQSVNLNAEYEILNHPDYAGRKIFETANMKMYNIQTELCHCFGIPMEFDQSDDMYYIPGTWDTRPDFNPALPETFEYKGPLTGKVGKIELGSRNFAGRDMNAIRRYFCDIPDCAQKYPQVRHVMNLIK